MRQYGNFPGIFLQSLSRANGRCLSYRRSLGWLLWALRLGDPEASRFDFLGQSSVSWGREFFQQMAQKHSGMMVFLAQVFFRCCWKMDTEDLQFSTCCTCRSGVLLGEPTLHMGNGWVGPYNPVDMCSWVVSEYNLPDWYHCHFGGVCKQESQMWRDLSRFPFHAIVDSLQKKGGIVLIWSAQIYQMKQTNTASWACFLRFFVNYPPES